MKIDLKRALLAGTAIVAMGTVLSSKEAKAQCATSGNIAADCNFISSNTEGAITLSSGTDVTFTSAGNTIHIAHTIDGTNSSSADGTLATGGNGTIVYQSANIGEGANGEIVGVTINSGDVWFLSGTGGTVDGGADILLASSLGTFTVDGGTLTFASGGSTISGDTELKSITFAGGSDGDTINFTSGAALDVQAGTATANYIYASSFNLAGGNDMITFSSNGDNNIDAKTFSTGAGNDTVTFNSGRINVGGAAGDTEGGGIFDLGAGNDTVTFSSATTTTGGAGEIIAANGFTAGTGNDTITFNSGGLINVGANTVDLGAGNDTLTFQSGGVITAGDVDGGAGTDTVTFNFSGMADISYDVSNFETANIGPRTAINFASAGFSGSTSVVMYDSSSLSFGGMTTETIAGTITGNDSAQQITINNANATVSSTISLGGGADTLNYTSGTLTGTVNFGAGSDTLNVGNNTGTVTISAAMSGLEDVVQATGSTVTLSAALTGVDDANDDGYNLGSNTLMIESGGSVDGAIHGAAGGSLFFGSSGNGGTFNLGGIVEDVQVFVSSGTLTTNGFAMGGNVGLATFFVSGGTLNANDNITIANSASQNGFVNNSTVNLEYDATIDAGNNAIWGGGTYNVQYFASGGTEQVGSFTNAGGAGRDIDFSSATFNWSVAPGSGVVQTGTNIIEYASATGGGDAMAPGTETDDSFLYNFVTVDNGTTLGLTITQAQSLASSTTTSNNLDVATVLLTDPDLAVSTDSNMQELQAAVSGASTQEEFNDALEQAQPTVDGSSVSAALTVSNNSFGIVTDRLASARTGKEVTGMTTGNLTQGVRAWMQGFGATGEQSQRDGIDGYDFNSYGVAVGMDTENIVENTVLGVAFSYADTDSDSDNASRTNTNTDSYQFTLYGDHDLDPDTYVNGMVAYAHNSVDTARTVVSAQANGEFDADQFTVRAEVGRDYSYQDATLTPHVLGHWTHYDAEDYTETGAGGAGLIVDQDTLNIVELGIGLDVSWLFQNADGSFFSPEISVGYRYDFAGDEVEMTSTYIAGGSAFTTTGFDPQQSTLNGGLGFTYFTTENWELTAEYDYEWKEDFDSHAGMARAAYRF